MIKISNLVYQYPAKNDPSHKALDSISLTLHEGEAVALMGSNGCGKTTLAHCLAAILIPQQGEVWIDNLNTRDQKSHVEIHKRVGLVFQNPENQIVTVTVEREIAFGLENLGIPQNKMREIVDAMLEKFQLTQYRYHPPHRLSGGELQRLALATVMSMSPKYLIFDEPTSLLDPPGRKMVLTMIQELLNENFEKPRDQKVAVLFITQFPEEALHFSRLLVMHQGRLVKDGSPMEIFQNVDELLELGVPVPPEFQVNQWLKHLSRGKISFNSSDFLSIL